LLVVSFIQFLFLLWIQSHEVGAKCGSPKTDVAQGKVTAAYESVSDQIVNDATAWANTVLSGGNK
jgi:hypothetical protein